MSLLYKESDGIYTVGGIDLLKAFPFLPGGHFSGVYQIRLYDHYKFFFPEIEIIKIQVSTNIQIVKFYVV